MARKKGASVDIAFEKIRSKIEHYELSPMDIISEIELSQEFNMSRTPIREAIYRLFDYGLVIRDGTRTVVKAISLKDVVEILQVREAIELMAVKVIINNGGLSEKQKKCINKIGESLRTSIVTQNLESNFKTDALFHKELVKYSNNERLLSVIEKLNVQGERLRWLTILSPKRYNSTCVEHENIIDAIQSFDLPKAEEGIRCHIQNTKQNYEQILQDNQWSNILKTLSQL